MKAKYSYNKSSIQLFQKQLSIRYKALPVLLRKETALRQVIVKRKASLAKQRERVQSLYADLKQLLPILPEWPFELKIKDLQLEKENLAGTKIEGLARVEYESLDLDFTHQEGWLAPAIAQLREYSTEKLRLDIDEKALQVLETARKKTTQKVNLYEKVQIPDYNEAIRKIKSFLEDKENIATAAAKIVKNRKSAEA